MDNFTLSSIFFFQYYYDPLPPLRLTVCTPLPLWGRKGGHVPPFLSPVKEIPTLAPWLIMEWKPPPPDVFEEVGNYLLFFFWVCSTWEIISTVANETPLQNHERRPLFSKCRQNRGGPPPFLSVFQIDPSPLGDEGFPPFFSPFLPQVASRSIFLPPYLDVPKKAASPSSVVVVDLFFFGPSIMITPFASPLFSTAMFSFPSFMYKTPLVDLGKHLSPLPLLLPLRRASLFFGSSASDLFLPLKS